MSNFKCINFCLVLVLLIGYSGNVMSQIAIGEWRAHISYNQIVSVTGSSDAIYAASERGIQIYQKDNNSLQTLSKVNGLSEANISEVYYSKANDMLLVGYNTGNLDVLKNDEITNYPQITTQSYYEERGINGIVDFNTETLLATDFGIVEFMPATGRFGNTYTVEEGQIIPVFEIVSTTNYIYAATSQGIYFAERDSYLADPSSWSGMDFLPEFGQSFNLVDIFNGKIIANYHNENGKDKIYAVENNSYEELITSTKEKVNDIYSAEGKLYIVSDNAIEIYNSQYSSIETIEQTEQGDLSPLTVYKMNSSLWIGDAELGLMKRNSNGYSQSFRKNGPSRNDIFRAVSSNGNIYLLGAGYNENYEKKGLPAHLSRFEEGNWENFSFSNIEDLASLSIKPGNPNLKYAGSWGDGLIELDGCSPVKFYDESNSPLAVAGSGDVRIRNLFFDGEDNLWMINHGTQHPVVVKSADGEWAKHKYDALADALIGNMISTENGFIWGYLPRKRSVFVIDDNNTSAVSHDDVVEIRKPVDRNGNVYDYKNDNIFAISEDLDGYIWLATEGGVLVETDPAGYFQEDSFQPTRLRISEGGDSDYLLRDNTVTDILVGPGNRKWFATKRSGVFLFSEGGDKMIHHFSEGNSPLLSDEIVDIELEEKKGELFIVTSKGVVSYRTGTSEAKDNFKETYVFPNPVKPDYEGPITITGLIDDVNVKITDISGNLVYETVSEGGQAIWQGKDLSGQKVSSGVYLVFITNEDGSKTHIEKILFIK